MKRFFFGLLVLACAAATAAAQDSTKAAVDRALVGRVGFGVSFGTALMTPNTINDGLEFYAASVDGEVRRVNNMTDVGVFLNYDYEAGSYVFLRADYLWSTRTIDFQTVRTTSPSGPEVDVSASNLSRFSAVPLTFGFGGRLPGGSSPLTMEGGVIYAFGMFHEEVTADGISTVMDADASGWGLTASMKLDFRFSQSVAVMFDLNYRFLEIRDFADSHGRSIGTHLMYKLTGIGFAGGLRFTL